MDQQILIWVGFNIFVIAMLAVDLKVFNRQAHEISIKEALIWTAAWIVQALIFNLIIYFWHGSGPAIEFLTGYLIEKSLSMDNLFVFLMIFSYFAVAPRFQHGVLYWGILGALIMRAIFIAAGITLIARFHWIIYIFGAFLIYTGIKLAFNDEEKIEPEKNPVLRLFRRFVPITDHYEGTKFFVRRAGRFMATPLFVVLLVIETTDVMFALDSIPAILAITRDPFIVYTSNVFAILGLRALYFALAGIMRMFYYVHYGLALILVFVGVKMLLSNFYHIPNFIALGMVGVILGLSVAASIIWPHEPEPLVPPPSRDEQPSLPPSQPVKPKEIKLS
jgi:tellurite resistance protein TerC